VSETLSGMGFGECPLCLLSELNFDLSMVFAVAVIIGRRFSSL
jgi:hypothetical protein